MQDTREQFSGMPESHVTPSYLPILCLLKSSTPTDKNRTLNGDFPQTVVSNLYKSTSSKRSPYPNPVAF